MELNVDAKPKSDDSEPHARQHLEMRVIDGTNLIDIRHTRRDELEIDQPVPDMVSSGVDFGCAAELELQAKLDVVDSVA